ncbi:hypothetical protein POVWA2_027830 [Plasmodium ovale wallikeri]|uniref:Uncharacterized protein n=1 Tax=Plasmodium ovale wallikeri TaxID=864142 RepID=A0A1A9ACR1_PLAOA|nr:hypothetical protein POVWA2_027830 [Plasmodium ovale wallikeri]SBT53990.1 hypothetical protein POVWA1_065320 [Plasmodium ovale wallikeri]
MFQQMVGQSHVHFREEMRERFGESSSLTFFFHKMEDEMGMRRGGRRAHVRAHIRAYAPAHMLTKKTVNAHASGYSTKQAS